MKEYHPNGPFTDQHPLLSGFLVGGLVGSIPILVFFAGSIVSGARAKAVQMNAAKK